MPDTPLSYPPVLIDTRYRVLPEWTVEGPSGTYRVERVNYEADMGGQIGNPLVRQTTPVLRCVPTSRCWNCSGTGDDPQMKRWAPESFFGCRCRWCRGVGSIHQDDSWDQEDLQRNAWATVIGFICHTLSATSLTWVLNELTAEGFIDAPWPTEITQPVREEFL